MTTLSGGPGYAEGCDATYTKLLQDYVDKAVPEAKGDALLKALRDYKTGVRVGYGNAVMPELVSQLRDADLQDLAHFLHYFRR